MEPQQSNKLVYEQLFENNKKWAAKHLARDPNFFTDLVQQQKPDLLWIGCSDSRVPANQIIGLKPGMTFFQTFNSYQSQVRSLFIVTLPM